MGLRSKPHRVFGGMLNECHWLVRFSSNVLARAGYLMNVQSKCHSDQFRSVGVAFHICLRRNIDVKCSKWILTSTTCSTEKRLPLKQTKGSQISALYLLAPCKSCFVLKCIFFIGQIQTATTAICIQIVYKSK